MAVSNQEVPAVRVIEEAAYVAGGFPQIIAGAGFQALHVSFEL